MNNYEINDKIKHPQLGHGRVIDIQYLSNDEIDVLIIFTERNDLHYSHLTMQHNMWCVGSKRICTCNTNRNCDSLACIVLGNYRKSGRARPTSSGSR